MPVTCQNSRQVVATRRCGFGRLGAGLSLCISHTLPGEAGAAGAALVEEPGSETWWGPSAVCSLTGPVAGQAEQAGKTGEPCSSACPEWVQPGFSSH